MQPLSNSLILITFLVTAICQNNLANNSFAADPDSKLEFELPTANSQKAVLAATPQAKGFVVFFFSTECPLSRLYTQRLNELYKQFNDQGIKFIAVNSTSQDNLDDIAKFKAELSVTFPLAKDYDNMVADNYQATRTAEVFLLNNLLQIVYHGKIDDQYSPGVSRSKANKHFLKSAIKSMIDGNEIVESKTRPVGCLIGRTKKPIEKPTVTYTNQISRLIQDNCLECHRVGEIGPFSLDRFEEAQGWAEMMVEVTENRRMPPWHATQEYLQFRNQRHLSKAQMKLFRDWLEQGTPYGDVAQLPPPKTFTSGWRLPKEPDQIIEMRKKPFVVQPTGTVEYQYFVVDPGFKEDCWISAAEVIPGNRSVVHHSIVFIRPPDGARFRGIGWLAAYVPGQGQPMFKETHAAFVPAGSKFVFQQHYTPTGTEQSDMTKIGIVFADSEKLTHEVYTLAALDQQFEIPPNATNHKVSASVGWFPKNGQILAFAPHMHYRGKAFELFTSVNGETKQLIDVPAYDFNWQHSYQPIDPITLKDIDEISCHFEFDNSGDNPFNPDANQTVTWGDQTWEEMAVAFFEIAQPIRNTDAAPVDEVAVAKTKMQSIDTEKLDAFVDDYFDRFDSNKDDKLLREELPRSVRRFGFWQYDQDYNGIVTRDELRNAAASRFRK